MKRTDAGTKLRRLLAEQLDATPPETTSAVRDLAVLGGLRVTAQTTTVIEKEIRVLIPDAHVELTYTRRDMDAAEPSALVTRLERHLYRLPETLRSTRTEAEAARSEATRAATRIGQPFEHVDELARLRHRQHEIDETIATRTEPPVIESDSSAPGASPIPLKPSSPVVDLTRQRLDRVASRDAVRSVGLSL